MSAESILVLARAPHFVATSVLWGGGGLLCLLRHAGVPLGERGPAARLLSVAGVLAAASGVAWLCATLAIVTGDPESLVRRDDWTAFLKSSFGPAWAIHLMLSGACLVLPCIAGRARETGAAILGAALALGQAWLGHAAVASGSGRALTMACYVIHVLAAFAWTGALAILLVLLLPGQHKRETLVAVLDAFSTFGLVTVTAIVATGLMNASVHVASAAALISSAYGLLVLIKFGLWSGMLLLAGQNRRASSEVTMTAGRPRKLLLGVGFKTILGALVLTTAALLGVTPPN